MKISGKNFHTRGVKSSESLQREEEIHSVEKISSEGRDQFEVDPDQRRGDADFFAEDEEESSPDVVAGDPVKFSQVDRAALLGAEELPPAVDTALLGVAQLFSEDSEK